MLDGMTLLYTYTKTVGIWSIIGIWIAFALFTVVAIYSWILWINRRGIKRLILALVTTLLCLCSLANAFEMKTVTETYYKVTIDHSVSYREFTYYYEVVDVEGEIYTIREIPQDIPNEVLPAPIETEPTIDPSDWLETDPPETGTETEPTWDDSAIG